MRNPLANFRKIHAKRNRAHNSTNDIIYQGMDSIYDAQLEGYQHALVKPRVVKSLVISLPGVISLPTCVRNDWEHGKPSRSPNLEFISAKCHLLCTVTIVLQLTCNWCVPPVWGELRVPSSSLSWFWSTTTTVRILLLLNLNLKWQRPES